MPTYRFPVLVWEDDTNHFTASLVEQAAPAAIGASAAEALLHLKEYLTWLYKNQSWRAGPDFFDAKLTEIKVAVRPEYRVQERIYPCNEALTLRIACVHGRDESGLLVGALPLLGPRFYYHEARELKDLVTHYVQEGLKGLAPRELSRFLPPRSLVLDEIVLNAPQREYRARCTPKLEILHAVAEPLGDRSLRRQFSRAWERDREVNDLVKRLSRERANVLLVGEPGVGKTSVLVEAVRQVERTLEAEQRADEDADEFNLYRYKYWLTSGARLIAGMQYLGQWQQRCESVIEELTSINGVLCVGSLLELVRSGSRNASESLAMFFQPYLQRGELRLIAEATPAELEACRRLLPGLVDLFQILPLPPFTRPQALAVLDRVAGNLSRNLRLEFAEDVTRTVYRLFQRFFPYLAFPGRTTAFLNELAELALRAGRKEVTAHDATEYFIRQTGLPELFLRDDLLLEQRDVLETFRRQIIGQEAACQTAAQLVTTFKAGLNDPQRPLGVLLFCGPTGVGKTELARAIARYFFGHGVETDRLVRLDLSEYAGWGAAERLLTAPDGEPSELIKRLRQQPFSVVLFDEIEKADAEVFDVLLSVFDEGRLTDRYGRTTSFRSAVIILTSNLGAEKLGAMGFGESAPPSYTAEAMSFFRPEFYNRLDAVVQFTPLDQTMMGAITRKELNELAAREGLAQRNLQLSWTEEVLEQLAQAGFDQRYGARPLQRTIETLVVAPLARYLIEHPDLADTAVEITLEQSGKLTFSWKK